METVQGSLFPFSSPATVLAHLERVTRRVTRLAPDLGARRCVRLLSELALLEAVLDAEERLIRHEVKLSAQRLGVLI
jgi:hypothetical protein